MKKKYLFLFILLQTSLTIANDDSRFFNNKNQKLNLPIGRLSYEEQDQFVIGRSFFTIPWVTAPSVTTARDGLGPLFNSNTCVSCHRGNGLGEKYNSDMQISRAMITKLSRGNGEAVPLYGKQIAVNGSLNVPFEALPTLTEEDIFIEYPDGSKATLKKPTYGLKNLNYGKLPDDVIIVQRRAPALTGLGLLQRVAEKDIVAFADPNDTNNDGISGRPNWIIKNGKKTIGRFTAKAGSISVKEQTAIAAIHDMGLTNPLFPDERCNDGQIACQSMPHGRPDPFGNTLDLTAERLDAIATFLKSTRAPKAKLDEFGEKGKQLFKQIGCNKCHIDNMKTSDGVEFSPYTDLLLHDMGDGLADNRQEYSANGNEFRTAPLWGISSYAQNLQSKTPFYLHDARAATLEEAILWHGGESEKSKQLFMELPKKDRSTIISFLKQL
ncbi:MAG: thiol oxidoreductase [Gammaproteobacteria bacterium]|nr:thiol oxidoreductase [Gammaproteobacteria bacterium]